MIALYVSAVALSVALGSLAILWYWIVPRMLAEPALRMIRMVEHTGMDEGPDPLTNTRTTKPIPVVQFLYWNMPYHTGAPPRSVRALPCIGPDARAAARYSGSAVHPPGPPRPGEEPSHFARLRTV